MTTIHKKSYKTNGKPKNPIPPGKRKKDDTPLNERYFLLFQMGVYNTISPSLAHYIFDKGKNGKYIEGVVFTAEQLLDSKISNTNKKRIEKMKVGSVPLIVRRISLECGLFTARVSKEKVDEYNRLFVAYDETSNKLKYIQKSIEKAVPHLIEQKKQKEKQRRIIDTQLKEFDNHSHWGVGEV